MLKKKLSHRNCLDLFSTSETLSKSTGISLAVAMFGHTLLTQLDLIRNPGKKTPKMFKQIYRRHSCLGAVWDV